MPRVVRCTTVLASTLVALGLVAAGVGAAYALPRTGYATWTIAPTAGGFTGTATLPVGFPAVSFITDSRAPTVIGSGISTYITPSSVVGIAFGSSAGKPYLSIRPKADAPGHPSTTTFTFAGPTPVGGWTWVAGDVDAETVTIAATDPAGNPVPAAALGATAFNYCVSPGSNCGNQTIVPTLTNSANLVTAADLNCTPVSIGNQCDTAGESARINPTVALRTLTVTSEGKQGPATFQSWFTTLGRSISGTARTTCTTTPTVQLLDGSGAVIATSTVAAGTFSFPFVAARSDYTVREIAAGATTDPPVAADVSAADATGLAVAANCAVAVVAVPDPPALAPTGTDPGLLAFSALVLITIGALLKVPRPGVSRRR